MLALVVAVDLLAAIVLIQQAIIARETIAKRSLQVPTSGAYAVTVTWPPGSNDDVDTYVEDPAGDIVYFRSQDAGLMHLEHDDLGQSLSGVQVEGAQTTIVHWNGERVVLRGTLTGSYVVNVQMYRKASTGSTPGPVPVEVQLWDLRTGAIVTGERVVLSREGDERTAFRFRLDRRGAVVSINHLQKRFVKADGQVSP